MGVQYLKAEEVLSIPGLQLCHITTPGTFNLSELKCQGQVMKAMILSISHSHQDSIVLAQRQKYRSMETE